MTRRPLTTRAAAALILPLYGLIVLFFAGIVYFVLNQK
jgi:hypothetical protein